jgi:hypothetical protein
MSRLKATLAVVSCLILLELFIVLFHPTDAILRTFILNSLAVPNLPHICPTFLPF